MAADNRKTFRLDEQAQEILTTAKDNRGSTENEAINMIILQYPIQGKKITELHNKTVDMQQQIYELERKLKAKDKEEAELLNAFRIVGRLFDSNSRADQDDAGAGQRYP